MTEAHLARERDRIQALAKEYQAQGYEIAINPTPQELPGFLAGFQPDLIVTRGGETTVVEVKSRKSLSADAQTHQIARLVEGRPGWRFELIILSGEPVDPPVGSVAFDRIGVKRALEEARSVLADGYTAPALLSGWAALEASLRLLLNEEGIELRRLAPVHLLKQAAEEGIISRDEYRSLSRLMAGRNAIAHGFEHESVNPTNVSALLELTERLLSETSSSQSV
jgi:hypothetical protein